MPNYLLAAIREQHGDDLARMAYADWLEEVGESDRAHFVRLQLQLHQQPSRSARAGELAVEAEGLLAEHERRWLGEWADLLVNWSFRRGLLDSVTVEPEVFLTRGAELLENHPLREVRFVGPDGDAADGEIAEEVVASPAFAGVRALDVSGARPSAAPQWCRALARATRHVTRLEEVNFGSAWLPGAVFDDAAALGELCEAEHLRSLRKLDLSSPLAGHSLGDDAIASLISAPFFPHLTDLSLAGCQLSDDGLRALILGRRLGNLEELDLSWCERLTRAGLQSLLSSTNLPKLSTLCLGGDVDVSALARSPLLGGVERLDVCTSAVRHPRSFPAAAWAEFAASPHVAGLRRLTLLHGILDEPGCQALFHTDGPLNLYSLMLLGGSAAMAGAIASSPALRSLTAVEAVACGFGAEEVKALLEAPFVPNLRQFCVAGNTIGTRGLQAILSSRLKGKALDDLHLHHCNLPAGAMKRLFAWQGLTNVTRLELGSNDLSADAMAAMLSSRRLGRLTTLHLATGTVSEEGLLALAGSTALPRLRDVTVGAVNDEVVAALRKRFGARLKVDPRG